METNSTKNVCFIQKKEEQGKTDYLATNENKIVEFTNLTVKLLPVCMNSVIFVAVCS